MTAPLDWSLPIYTVPDERNPVPVRCDVDRPRFSSTVKTVVIRDVWLDGDGDNMGGRWWRYLPNGQPEFGDLPRLQNLPSKETA